MVGPFGGTDGDLGAPTTTVGDVDGGPPRRRYRRPESPPPMSEMSMAGSLGGADGDLGAATTYDEDVNGRPPYQALVEIWECSPPFWKTLMVHPPRGSTLCSWFEDVL
jgi:hypothetical protein